MITTKSQREIELMRIAGDIVACCHELLATMISPGVSTLDLDVAAEEYIRSRNAIPSFKNYNGFPSTLCISINDEVVHGMPSKDKVLKDGDIVSIDIGACYENYHGDSAWTYPVGNISDEAKLLLKLTEESLYSGLAACNNKARVGDISSSIGKFAKSHNLGIVKELTGHGIGRELHEEPYVPNYGNAGFGPRLKVGMTIAIEPMLNLGTGDVVMLDDGWTIVTADSKLSAHFEHTIVITEDGYEILTKKMEDSNG